MSGNLFQIEEEFWRDHLEVGTARVVDEHRRDDEMRRWIATLTPRCRTVLVEHFGLAPTDDLKAALFARRAELLPFLLVDAAMEGKRGLAIEQLAQSTLPPEAVAACRKPALVGGVTSYDRRALLWRLYLADPANIEAVFHLDRMQRKGFARMVVDDAPPVNGIDPGAFLNRATLQGLLDRFEAENDSARQSHCAAVLNGDGRYRVFIKRDMKEAFVSHGPKNTFGFSREWIILVFEQGLRRVQVCSVSPSVPPKLASRIATGFFGVPVNYTNEVIETSTETVAAFLRSLLAEPARLPLVELVTKGCGLDGAPQLRISDPGHTSIAPAVLQFARAFDNPLDNLDLVESLKVWFVDKRVKLLFEPVDKAGSAYVVRYADQPLDTRERREFEELMWTDYGIRVLSTEKKHHAAAA